MNKVCRFGRCMRAADDGHVYCSEHRGNPVPMQVEYAVYDRNFVIFGHASSLESMEQEAERLAKENPGKIYEIHKIIARVYLPNAEVTWQRIS